MNLLQMPNLVAGEWRPAGAGDRIEVRNPADTREVVAEVPAMSAADITAVLDGAAEGARVWRRTGPLARATVLHRAAALLRERAEAIARDLVSEMGKTLTEARGEVDKAADFFDFYAAQARMPSGYAVADARPATTTTVRYEPVGVVVAITPWNDPLLTPARKVAPALSCGNAVILKPATDTPLVAWRLAQALADAGVPAGVFSTVTGRGSAISPALLGDDRVAAVTFTGSTEVGLALQRDLAGRNVRLQTEMGGKNAAVVLDDADLDLAAATIAAAGFGQAGQRCTATSRVIVTHGVAEALVDRLLARAAELRLGPGLADGTTLGPVVSERHRREVLGHIEKAAEDGATVRCGGPATTDPALAHGCFVAPTVLTGVTRDMRIWREEVFGPVIAVHVVADLDEAIDAVNDSAFGLSASIFTTGLAATDRFLDEADTGQVAVNLPTSGWDVHHPFGGFRLSGSAFKEQGVEALHFYTRVKTCAVRTR
ncbi:aldehyde dehydrogenase family protein [Micromonospora sp. NPDC005087]|uniref:aldehyde dehydrogenase family protein n=1 Tax=Micromonospora sp. NPDC005087 TaxID=3364225 RepID=UPI0036A3ABFC